MSLAWARESWPGGGDHEGHTVTPIERWPTRIDDNKLTCGRVRCSCADEWNVGGWPTDRARIMFDTTQETR